MTARKKIDKPGEDVELRYANWLKQIIDIISPQSVYLPIGRGAGKTTDILAERSMDIVYDMPGAYFALVGDTYLNLVKNVVPSLLEGWQRKGWINGIHYVVDERPPDNFARPYKPLHNYKHTICTWNGCVFKLVSMDRPSTGAGDSYQHLFGDESKYLKEKKLNKLTPAIRGESLRFLKSPFYRGHTFTTDMPNAQHGEDEWILKMKKKMDVDRVKLALQAGLVCNEIRKELMAARRDGNKKAEKKILRNLERWEERHRKTRKHLTLFYVASSFINSATLTAEYFHDIFTTMDPEEYSVSVLSIPPRLAKGARFYPNLTADHFYHDGILYDRYDLAKLGTKVDDSCDDLKYLDKISKLEAGYDAGNMHSLVIGQLQGGTMRVMKNMHMLSSEGWIDELGKKFTQYFATHQNKVLELYHDRAANQYKQAGKDFASHMKKAIEYHDGQPTGWVVKLMSRNQGNITHFQEYDLCHQMMGGSNKALPGLQIDAYNCRELKSSLEMAPAEIKDSGQDKKTIKKVKTSERLPLKDLPMKSTNYSDAFKYLICRSSWLIIAANKGGSFSMATPQVY